MHATNCKTWRSVKCDPLRPRSTVVFVAGMVWLMAMAFVTGAAAAVTLLSFTAEWQAGGWIRVRWETATELDTVAFRLYRATAEAGPYGEHIFHVPALGDAVSGDTYEYQDSEVTPGVTYYYKLEEITTNGSTTTLGTVVAVQPETAIPTPTSTTPASLPSLTATATTASTANPTATRTATPVRSSTRTPTPVTIGGPALTSTHTPEPASTNPPGATATAIIPNISQPATLAPPPSTRATVSASAFLPQATPGIVAVATQPAVPSPAPGTPVIAMLTPLPEATLPSSSQATTPGSEPARQGAPTTAMTQPASSATLPSSQQAAGASGLTLLPGGWVTVGFAILLGIFALVIWRVR